MAPRDAIRAFLEEYPPDRYATTQPSGVGQTLGLAEARLQALALLLKKDPDRLRRVLDEVVHGDFSEAALAEARRALGILNRKTLKELLEGSEPGPGPLPEPITLAGKGPSAAEMVSEDREAPSSKGHFESKESLTEVEAEAFLQSIGRGGRKPRGRRR